MGLARDAKLICSSTPTTESRVDARTYMYVATCIHVHVFMYIYDVQFVSRVLLGNGLSPDPMRRFSESSTGRRLQVDWALCDAGSAPSDTASASASWMNWKCSNYHRALLYQRGCLSRTSKKHPRNLMASKYPTTCSSHPRISSMLCRYSVPPSHPPLS